MARISTKTQAANLMLSLLKVKAVSSIDPPDVNSKGANAAARWYDPSRREVLQDHIWNFALKRVMLPADTTAPVFGYNVRYLLPADFIRIATIGDEDNPERDYKIEDGYLLCNVDAPLPMIYVYDQEDLTKWSDKAIQALARKMATYCAYEVTGNRSMVKEMDDGYKDILTDGTAIDGQDSPPTHAIRRSKWRTAKEGGSMGGVTGGRVVV